MAFLKSAFSTVLTPKPSLALNLCRVDLPVTAKSNFPEITSDSVTILSNNLVFLLLAHPRIAPARLEYINHGIITTNSVDCDCFGDLCCSRQYLYCTDTAQTDSATVGSSGVCASARRPDSAACGRYGVDFR